MIRQPISPTTKVILGLASVLCLIAGYAWLSHRLRVVNPKNTAMPNLTQFVEGWDRITRAPRNSEAIGLEAFRESWLWEDLCATYGRLILGLATGVLLSLVIGIAMGCLTPVEAFFVPPLSFFAKIPPTAMLAVYFVAFGTDIQLFVALIALGIFPTLTQSIYQAAKKDVTSHAIDKAYTLGASHAEVIWNVILRQILPRIIENVRLQVGPAMVFLIAAEWLLTDVGFGYRLRLQSRLLNMNVVYIYLVILGMTGFVFDWLLSVTRRKLSPWFGE